MGKEDGQTRRGEMSNKEVVGALVFLPLLAINMAAACVGTESLVLDLDVNKTGEMVLWVAGIADVAVGWFAAQGIKGFAREVKATNN